MSAIEIPREVDRFVLYFDTPKNEISASALATSLVGLSDAVRVANAAVNPGYHVEVVVEALGDGSFQAVVRTIFEKSKNLFSHEAVKAIVYGVISTYIYETGVKSEAPVNVIVNDGSVIVESGSERIVVPRDVYEAKKQLERSEHFVSAVGRVFDGATSDASVRGLGIKIAPDKSPPPIYVPRERFAIFETPRLDDGSREIVEFANLEISRAILARGRRKWEFYWRGMRISAPVLDAGFYDKFFAHEIKIAPGDGLRVALKIIQYRHPDTGIFVNDRYEVIEVYEHLPRERQNVL